MFERWSFLFKPFAPRAEAGAQEVHVQPDGTQEAGLVSSTLVATAQGWTPVRNLKPGDLVLTFDAGLQPVTKVSSEVPFETAQDCPSALWPLEVPKGAFGNATPYHLLSGQNIMVESDAAEDMFGDPFSVIPASALVGLRGIERVPPKDGMEVVRISFADEQVVFGEHGALYLCASSRDMVEMALEQRPDPLYAILPPAEARVVASSLGEDFASIAGETPRDILGAALA